MHTNIFILKAALALTLCSSGWCLASDIPRDDSLQVAQSGVEAEGKSAEQSAEKLATLPLEATVVVAAAEPVLVSGFGVPMASEQLAGYRGGFDVVKNDMQLSGSVANNSAYNVMSGNNNIADGSFANSSGFPMVIQNSGSNVLIQNATIINLQYQQ